MKKSLLIIGKPNSTKTSFLAQLYSRLDGNYGELKFYEVIKNQAPIFDAVNRLAQGIEVQPTPPEKNTGIVLPIQVKEEKVDLYFPDYGGEQINLMIESREVNVEWSNSIKESNNWILFIRPTSVNLGYDLSNKTVKKEEAEGNAPTSEAEYSVSDQTSYIELIQIMLSIKEQDAHFKNSSSKLTIVLTCWDEVKDDDTPKQKLKKTLPLLLEFIESNWHEGMIKVLGLSALGFSLKDDKNKVKYQEEGAEKFGYLIKPDGTETNDITQLILEAI